MLTVALTFINLFIYLLLRDEVSTYSNQLYRKVIKDIKKINIFIKLDFMDLTSGAVVGKTVQNFVWSRLKSGFCLDKNIFFSPD